MKITSDLTNLTTAILILTVQIFIEWTLFNSSSALIVITSRANRSKLCVRKKVKISVDVTTSRVMGNCNSITEITEGKIYSNCQNLNV
jgi:hypothetical protein